MLACWIRGKKHLTIGAPASHMGSIHSMSEVCMYCQPTQVQLMRGEFLETVLYWAGVVSVRLGGIAEKKVSHYFCVRVSVCVRQPVH